MKFNWQTIKWEHESPSYSENTGTFWGPSDFLSNSEVLSAIEYMLCTRVPTAAPSGFEEHYHNLYRSNPTSDYNTLNSGNPKYGMSRFVNSPSGTIDIQNKAVVTLLEQILCKSTPGLGGAVLVQLQDSILPRVQTDKSNNLFWRSISILDPSGQRTTTTVAHDNTFFKTNYTFIGHSSADTLIYKYNGTTIDQYLDGNYNNTMSFEDSGGFRTFTGIYGYPIAVSSGTYATWASGEMAEFPLRWTIDGIIKTANVERIGNGWDEASGDFDRKTIGIGYLGFNPHQPVYTPINKTVRLGINSSGYIPVEVNRIWADPNSVANTFNGFLMTCPSGIQVTLKPESAGFVAGRAWSSNVPRVDASSLIWAYNTVKNEYDWGNFRPGIANCDSFDQACNYSDPFASGVMRFTYPGGEFLSNGSISGLLGFTPISTKYYDPIINPLIRKFIYYYSQESGIAVVQDAIASIRKGSPVEWIYPLESNDFNLKIVGYSPSSSTVNRTFTYLSSSYYDFRFYPSGSANYFAIEKINAAGNSINTSGTLDISGFSLSGLINIGHGTIGGSVGQSPIIGIQTDKIVPILQTSPYLLHPSSGMSYIDASGIIDFTNSEYIDIPSTIDTTNQSKSVNAIKNNINIINGYTAPNSFVGTFDNGVYLCDLVCYNNYGMVNQSQLSLRFIKFDLYYSGKPQPTGDVTSILANSSYYNVTKCIDHYLDSFFSFDASAVTSSYSTRTNSTFGTNKSYYGVSDHCWHPTNLKQYAIVNGGILEIDYVNQSTKLYAYDSTSISILDTQRGSSTATTSTSQLFYYNFSLVMFVRFLNNSTSKYYNIALNTSDCTLSDAGSLIPSVTNPSVIKNIFPLSKIYVVSSSGEYFYSDSNLTNPIKSYLTNIGLASHAAMIYFNLSFSSSTVFGMFTRVDRAMNSPYFSGRPFPTYPNNIKVQQTTSTLSLVKNVNIPVSANPKFLITSPRANSNITPFFGTKYGYLTSNHYVEKTTVGDHLVGKSEYRTKGNTHNIDQPISFGSPFGSRIYLTPFSGIIGTDTSTRFIDLLSSSASATSTNNFREKSPTDISYSSRSQFINTSIIPGDSSYQPYIPNILTSSPINSTTSYYINNNNHIYGSGVTSPEANYLNFKFMSQYFTSTVNRLFVFTDDYINNKSQINYICPSSGYIYTSGVDIITQGRQIGPYLLKSDHVAIKNGMAFPYVENGSVKDKANIDLAIRTFIRLDVGSEYPTPYPLLPSGAASVPKNVTPILGVQRDSDNKIWINNNFSSSGHYIPNFNGADQAYLYEKSGADSIIARNPWTGDRITQQTKYIDSDLYKIIPSQMGGIFPGYLQNSRLIDSNAGAATSAASIAGKLSPREFTGSDSTSRTLVTQNRDDTIGASWIVSAGVSGTAVNLSELVGTNFKYLRKKQPDRVYGDFITPILNKVESYSVYPSGKMDISDAIFLGGNFLGITFRNFNYDIQVGGIANNMSVTTGALGINIADGSITEMYSRTVAESPGRIDLIDIPVSFSSSTDGCFMFREAIRASTSGSITENRVHHYDTVGSFHTMVSYPSSATISFVNCSHNTAHCCISAASGVTSFRDADGNFLLSGTGTSSLFNQYNTYGIPNSSFFAKKDGEYYFNISGCIVGLNSQHYAGVHPKEMFSYAYPGIF